MGEAITIGLAAVFAGVAIYLWRRAMAHDRRRADRVSRAWLDRHGR